MRLPMRPPPELDSDIGCELGCWGRYSGYEGEVLKSERGDGGVRLDGPGGWLGVRGRKHWEDYGGRLWDSHTFRSLSGQKD